MKLYKAVASGNIDDTDLELVFECDDVEQLKSLGLDKSAEMGVIDVVWIACDNKRSSWQELSDRKTVFFYIRP
jgi:hypothetical protein